jgi:predicted homoserine dehydrogenase-like protein
MPSQPKNIVMLNVETDVTVGVLLDRMALNAAASIPLHRARAAVCKMLYDFLAR